MGKTEKLSPITATVFLHLHTEFETLNLKMKKSIIYIAGIILAGALLRLVPHWPNFTPIAAMALIGGTYIRRKELAFALPFAAMLLSDTIIGWHSMMLPVYIGFGLIVMLGFLLRKKPGILQIGSASIVSSLLFFFITNFAVWQGGMMPYSKDISGLLESYTMGLPFLWNGIAGDLFYNALFFGAFYLIVNNQLISVKENK